MKNYMIAHDLGTSCDKASLLTLDGTIVKSHSISYSIDFKNRLWAEQNPEDWWNAFCENNRILLKNIHPNEVAGISVSGQMMTCLPICEGKALYPAIIWADGRAQAESEFLESQLGMDEYYKITGMRPSANYSLPKIIWFKDHFPELYHRTRVFLGPKDYINMKLTGRCVTDTEDAAYMHCLDIKQETWSQKLLDVANIDIEKMPEILRPGSILSEVTTSAAAQSGLAKGTPVILGTGDGGATTLGTATLERGDAYTSIGTSSWVCAITNGDVMDPKHSISKLRFLDSYRDSGTMQAGGYSYSWLKDTICQQEVEAAQKTGESPYRRIDNLAAQSPPGANGVLFLPYLMGERAPYWDMKLKGAFLGLSAYNKKQDLYRSVLEGVSMHLGLILNRIRSVNDPLDIQCMKLVGGGSQNPMWRQIFADVYNLPVITTNISDQAGTLGTAVIIGMAVGIYHDISVVKQFHNNIQVTEPINRNVQLYQKLLQVFEESCQVLVKTNHQLSDIFSAADM